MNSIMRHDNNQNRIYSRKIISGKLTKEDIELGLQNKCIDSSCLNDANINNYMEIVGDNMRSAKIDIMSNINELYYFMEFLNSEEIIILETIKKILVQLPEMDGRHSNPFYPNLASHADEIFLLYNSYCRLLPCIFDDNSSTIRTNKYIDIGFPIAEINYHLYFSNNYKKCIKTIEQVNKEIPSFFPVPEDFFTLQFIESHYKQRNRNIAFKTFKGYYIKQEENIRTKMYIIDLFHKYDKRIINWSKEKMNEDEKYLLSLSLDKMNLNDINKLNDFKKNNNYLKEYFDNRNNESK